MRRSLCQNHNVFQSFFYCRSRREEAPDFKIAGSEPPHVGSYNFILNRRLPNRVEETLSRFDRDWLLCFGISRFDQFGRQFLKEGRWVAGQRLAVFFAAQTVAQGERL